LFNFTFIVKHTKFGVKIDQITLHFGQEILYFLPSFSRSKTFDEKKKLFNFHLKRFLLFANLAVVNQSTRYEIEFKLINFSHATRALQILIFNLFAKSFLSFLNGIS
jgi:hypothetical protein